MAARNCTDHVDMSEKRYFSRWENVAGHFELAPQSMLALQLKVFFPTYCLRTPIIQADTVQQSYLIEQ